MQNDPAKIQQVVPLHFSYSKNSNPKGYPAGQFTDKSGGLIAFMANSIDEAENLINRDPFILNNLLENKWIKQWIVD